VKRQHCSLVAVAAALGALASWAPNALAGPGLYIDLKNELAPAAPADVRLVAARARNCWYDGALWPVERAPVVSPGRSSQIYTEKNNEFGTGCYEGRGARGIEMQIREPGRNWETPAGSPGDYKIVFNPKTDSSSFGFNFENGLTTWLPRADGRGLMCWNTYTRTSRKNNITATGYADINILGDRRCNRVVPANIKPDPSRYLAAPDPANSRLQTSPAVGQPPTATAKADAGSPAIVNLLSTVGVACSWYAFPGNAQYCNSLNVGDPAKWVLGNVPSSVQGFEVTNSIVKPEPKYPVGTTSLRVPATSGEGNLSIDKTVRRRTETATTTTHGASAGIELEFEETSSFGLKGIAEGGFTARQKVTAGYNYSNAQAKTTADETEIRVAINAAAKPGYETTLDVFTTRVSANYEYAADLTFGKAGTVTPVVTPATQALNMSPATRQPCLGYIVGDATVRNSIMNIGKAQTDAGNKDTEPTLAPERRAFLRAVPFFKTAKAECPGFPSGFASEAAFKGTGVGTYDNLGYDEDGRPRSAMVGCVYQRPIQSGSRAASIQPPTYRAQATAPDSPCQTIPGGTGTVETGETTRRRPAEGSGRSVSSPGVLIEARGAEETDGTPVSDKVIGTDADEEISTGAGTFDQVYAGDGDDLVRGGRGEDLIHGEEGDDALEGGGGFDTVYGDAGSDRILESGGAGSLNGSGDADTLIAEGGDGLVMLGGAGDDRLVSRGQGVRALSGNGGDDRYVLEGNGDDTLLEMPDEGSDVVSTDRSFDVPAEIEEAVASGDRRVNLSSGDGRQTLVGNDAANELDGGIGSDRVEGAGGDDRILLSSFGFDRATGGAGADAFVPLGDPANANRPTALERPRDRTAHLITDFQPRRGDRIVMRTSVFGDSLNARPGPVPIVSDRDPQPRKPRGTILFDKRSGVVSFDRDGTGPVSDKVAVVLPDAQTLRRSWLVISR